MTHDGPTRTQVGSPGEDRDAGVAPHRARVLPVGSGLPLKIVATAADAEQMNAQIACSRVEVVGLDTKVRRSGVERDDEEVADPMRPDPIAVGVVALIRDGDRFSPLRYAVDLRRPEVLGGVAKLLGHTTTFVAHRFKKEYFVLHALGLPWPGNFVCTHLAAKLLNLGRFDRRYQGYGGADRDDDVAADRLAAEAERSAASLPSLSRDFGVLWPALGPEERLRARLGARDARQDLDQELGAYVVAEALVAAAVHPHLRNALIGAGLADHFENIELPGAIVLAEIERQGVTIDSAKLALARQAADSAVRALEKQLKQFGFPDARAVESHADRIRVLDGLGLLQLFKVGPTYSFSDDALKAHRGRHLAIKLLHLHGKYRQIVNNPLFAGELVSADGRVRPRIEPLGAATGRPTFHRPNLVGIGRVFRPIVVPDAPGYGLAELDYSAQEVFIAGSHFGDALLVRDCNEGDPYWRLVRSLCSAELDPGDEDLPDGALATRHADLRDRMKLLMLGVLYGAGDETIASQARTTPAGARQLRNDLLRRYPQLAQGMRESRNQLQESGYTSTVTGLKRYRGAAGPLMRWEQRWAVNAPIQGGGACVLKLLLPRLHEMLVQLGGRIVLPVYDAVVVQYPLAEKRMALDGAHAIMIDAMRELYPDLRPRVDVNDLDPSCWNKKGRGDSIERFAADPMFRP